MGILLLGNAIAFFVSQCSFLSAYIYDCSYNQRIEIQDCDDIEYVCIINCHHNSLIKIEGCNNIDTVDLTNCDYNNIELWYTSNIGDALATSGVFIRDCDNNMIYLAYCQHIYVYVDSDSEGNSYRMTSCSDINISPLPIYYSYGSILRFPTGETYTDEKLTTYVYSESLCSAIYESDISSPLEESTINTTYDQPVSNATTHINDSKETNSYDSKAREYEYDVVPDNALTMKNQKVLLEENLERSFRHRENAFLAILLDIATLKNLYMLYMNYPVFCLRIDYIIIHNFRPSRKL